ncbi:MAG: hypothetical protein ABLQ96_01990 [Candidatus Acidiferrum sp.]
MYGQLKKNKVRRQRALWENVLLLFMGVMAFLLAGAAHDRGIAEKWVTALFGTVFPFALVTYLRRESLRRSFWMSLTICLVAHCIVIAAIFQYVLGAFQKFSPLLWLAPMLLEVVVLLIVVKRIETKLTGKNETVKLSF